MWQILNLAQNPDRNSERFNDKYPESPPQNSNTYFFPILCARSTVGFTTISKRDGIFL